MIEIFVDASYCHETGAAAWAARVIRGKANHTYGGGFPFDVVGSTEAEIAAVAMAVSVLQDLAPASVIEVNTDCCNAIRMLMAALPRAKAVAGRVTLAPAKRPGRLGKWSEAYRRLHAAVEAKSLILNLRYLDRTDPDERRLSYLRACDSAARGKMRKLRAAMVEAYERELEPANDSPYSGQRP